MTINSDIRLTQINKQVKPPAVAGYFYPADATELQAFINSLLAAAATDNPPPKAIVAPHAGYVYSGPVAANIYASLRPVRSLIKRVVLLGPAHRVYVRAMAISSASHFATPLGEIKIDAELRKRISQYPQVSLLDEAFAQEHSLEVHLPFLQTMLEDFSLLPIVVGEASEKEVADVLESVWGGDETLIVISSDLSHFHDYQTAREIDSNTADIIKNLEFEKLGPQQACGCRPVNGLLKIARQRGLEINIIDVRNSGDTAGNHDRVVGYGAFAVYETHHLNPEQRRQLIDIAYASIKHGLQKNEPLIPMSEGYPAVFAEPRAVFVTLTLDNNLRGCIGNTEPVYPLMVATAKNAYNAAFCDPRFKPLSAAEFDRLELDISVLSPKQEIHFTSDSELLQKIHAGKDGLIIIRGTRSATFLPTVWEKLPDPELFLRQLKLKAGMGPHEIPERAFIYQSESFS